MADYTLDQMLTVREHRETLRLNELAKSKASVRQAEAERQRTTTAFNDYCQWRPREEQRLFDHLKGKSASVQDLHHYTDSLNTLRNDEVAMAQQVDEASDRLASARSDMVTARQQYACAHRKKVKISEHKIIWTEQQRCRSERQADEEMEEIGQNLSLSGTGRLYI